jgi:hypothetical protein
MPLCAEIVDAFRDAGLLTNADIARGMKEGTFFCEEAGHQIGDPAKRAALDAACVRVTGTTTEERRRLEEIRNRNAKGSK